MLVILDGYTLNPGDLSWSEIESLTPFRIYDRTAETEIVERAKDAQYILTNKTPLTAETLKQLPNLKYVGVLATGYNVVDVAAARQLGITVTNIPSYSTMSVAQNVFAMLLALTNRAEHYASEFEAGEWSRSKDFCYANTSLYELAGKSFGIVGYGNIGRAVARIAEALGMRVCVASSKPAEALDGAVKMEIDTLFRECDVVSLHCPLTAETAGLVDAERLRSMKPTAILINTGRGPLIDESALAEALRRGEIAGACLDVLCQEPPAASNPLIGAPNLIVTPHISWATYEARTRLMGIAADNLRAYLNGAPINTVN